MNAEIISTLLMIIGGVTILTNIIVQVVKTVTWDRKRNDGRRRQ